MNHLEVQFDDVYTFNSITMMAKWSKYRKMLQLGDGMWVFIILSTFLYIWTFYDKKFFKLNRRWVILVIPFHRWESRGMGGQLVSPRSQSQRVAELDWAPRHALLPPSILSVCWRSVNKYLLTGQQWFKGLWPFHLRHVPGMHALLWLNLPRISQAASGLIGLLPCP